MVIFKNGSGPESVWLGQERGDSGPSFCLTPIISFGGSLIPLSFITWGSVSPESNSSSSLCKALWSLCVSTHAGYWQSVWASSSTDWQSDSVPLEVPSIQSCISHFPRSRWMYLWRMWSSLSCTLILSWEHLLVGCSRHHCIFCPTLCRAVRYSGVCLHLEINWEGCFRGLCFFKTNTKAKQSNWLPQNKALPFLPTCTANIK